MSKLSPQLSRIKARLKEAGNVLFMILIAVALFAALAYAVTNSTRSGGSDASKENNVLLASQLTQYGTELQTAIMRMKISNGCTDDQISFENPIVSGYTNAEAPANYTCHVFRPEGGAVTYKTPPLGVNTLGSITPNTYTLSDRLPYIFDGVRCSLGIGTDGSTTNCKTSVSAMELIMYVPVYRIELCNEINTKLGNGLTSPPTITGYWAGSAASVGYGKFSSSQKYTAYYNDLPAGKHSACVQAGNTGDNMFPRYTGNIYYFYHVLIAR